MFVQSPFMAEYMVKFFVVEKKMNSLWFGGTLFIMYVSVTSNMLIMFKSSYFYNFLLILFISFNERDM